MLRLPCNVVTVSVRSKCLLSVMVSEALRLGEHHSQLCVLLSESLALFVVATSETLLFSSLHAHQRKYVVGQCGVGPVSIIRFLGQRVQLGCNRIV